MDVAHFISTELNSDRMRTFALSCAYAALDVWEASYPNNTQARALVDRAGGGERVRRTELELQDYSGTAESVKAWHCIYEALEVLGDPFNCEARSMARNAHAAGQHLSDQWAVLGELMNIDPEIRGLWCSIMEDWDGDYSDVAGIISRLHAPAVVQA